MPYLVRIPTCLAFQALSASYPATAVWHQARVQHLAFLLTFGTAGAHLLHHLQARLALSTKRGDHIFAIIYDQTHLIPTVGHLLLGKLNF